MGKIYHFHADVGTSGALNCGLLNGHDLSCSKGILTNANEDSCDKVTANFPQGKPHKCYHIVPDDALHALTRKQSPIDIWLVEPRKQKASPQAKKKKRK